MSNFFHNLDLKKIKWIYFISRRFSKVDRKNKGHATSTLSSIGICFGVMALIVVLSVMNGFQMSFIDSILEISSYHVQVQELPVSVYEKTEKDFISWANGSKDIVSVTPFMEAQGLFVGTSTKQAAGIIRAIPNDVFFMDSGFVRELQITQGQFDLSDDDSIILGSELARLLGARVGTVINIAALSGSSDVALLSENRQFTVKGIYRCGYSEINSAYAFIPFSAGKKYFGKGASVSYGIKLKKYSSSENFIHIIKNEMDGIFEKYISFGSINSNEIENVSVKNWKEFNRSFFGTLRIEKNIIMLLVLLIFIVVAVNIYNGMRKMVFERSQEIAVLQALGASEKDVLNVFLIKGFMTGLKGSFPGLLLGLLISKNMSVVFSIISNIYYYAELGFTKIFNPSAVQFVTENPMFRLYGNIQTRVIPSEVIMVFLFGLLASFLASLFAGKKIMSVTLSEVLRNE